MNAAIIDQDVENEVNFARTRHSLCDSDEGVVAPLQRNDLMELPAFEARILNT